MENPISIDQPVDKKEVVELVKDVKKTSKGKRVESDFLKARIKALAIYKCQIDKSVHMKRKAIERAFNKVVSGNYTWKRFLSEFQGLVYLLLDSKRFELDCKSYNLDPFSAATHIAFDGASKIELVLRNGLYATYTTQITELVDPLFTEEELNSASKVKSEASTAV